MDFDIGAPSGMGAFFVILQSLQRYSTTNNTAHDKVSFHNSIWHNAIRVLQ